MNNLRTSSVLREIKRAVDHWQSFSSHTGVSLKGLHTIHPSLSLPSLSLSLSLSLSAIVGVAKIGLKLILIGPNQTRAGPAR